VNPHNVELSLATEARPIVAETTLPDPSPMYRPCDAGPGADRAISWGALLTAGRSPDAPANSSPTSRSSTSAAAVSMNGSRRKGLEASWSPSSALPAHWYRGLRGGAWAERADGGTDLGLGAGFGFLGDASPSLIIWRPTARDQTASCRASRRQGLWSLLAAH
jgi:hypothetical protein